VLAANLPRYFPFLADALDSDIQKLIAVLSWLQANPDRQLYIRQLPIKGVDTKWLGNHKNSSVNYWPACMRWKVNLVTFMQ